MCTWKPGCSCQEWLMFKEHKENEGSKCIFKVRFFCCLELVSAFLPVQNTASLFRKWNTHIKEEVVWIVKESSSLQIIPCMKKKPKTNSLIKLLAYVDEIKKNYFSLSFLYIIAKKIGFIIWLTYSLFFLDVVLTEIEESRTELHSVIIT